MPFFIDTSALVKRYRTEHGSAFVNELYEFECRKAERLYAAAHTITEFGSTSMRLFREGVVTSIEADSMINNFQKESLSLLFLIDLARPIIFRSLMLVRKHPLKGADALQLACACDAFEIFKPDFHFVCDDVRLCSAAEAEGMKVLRPSNSESITYLRSL